MKTKTALSWLLLAGMLACGATHAASPVRDTDAIYGSALHMTWLQGENRATATLDGMDSHLMRDQAKDRDDLQAYHASVRAAARNGGQFVLNVYALGCVIYLAFIFLLGLFVGFNDLDRDK